MGHPVAGVRGHRGRGHWLELPHLHLANIRVAKCGSNRPCHLSPWSEPAGHTLADAACPPPSSQTPSGALLSMPLAWGRGGRLWQEYETLRLPLHARTVKFNRTHIPARDGVPVRTRSVGRVLHEWAGWAAAESGEADRCSVTWMSCRCDPFPQTALIKLSKNNRHLTPGLMNFTDGARGRGGHGASVWESSHGYVTDTNSSNCDASSAPSSQPPGLSRQGWAGSARSGSAGQGRSGDG